MTTESRKKPGPEGETLSVEADWRDAMKRALLAKRPPTGWPDRPAKPRKKRRKAKGK